MTNWTDIELAFLSLISSTVVEEDPEVYLTKLALSMGRSTCCLVS